MKRCRSLCLVLLLLLASCSSAETSIGDPPEVVTDSERDVREPVVEEFVETEPTRESEELPDEPIPEQELVLVDDEQINDRVFLGALIGSWESPGCGSNGSCTIWTFEANGEFTYDFTTDDYDDEYSNRWSAQVVADGVGLVAFEDAGIHLFVIDEQGLRVPGQVSGFVKTASGVLVDDLVPVDPGQLANDVLGTWFRPKGAAVDGVVRPEELTLHSSGAFEATYGDVSCAGLWAFDVAGDMGNNRGDSGEGSLRLHSRELCDNRESYLDRIKWDAVNSFTVTSFDGLMFFDDLEHRNAPSSDLHFFGQHSTSAKVRIAEPIIAGEPVVLVVEIDQPMQYGLLADEVHAITVYTSGSAVRSPGEEIVADGTKLEINEPIAVVPGERALIEIPLVFVDPNPSAHIQLQFTMFLDGERATQTEPMARITVEVAG